MGFQFINPKIWLRLLQLDEERHTRVNHFQQSVQEERKRQ